MAVRSHFLAVGNAEQVVAELRLIVRRSLVSCLLFATACLPPVSVDGRPCPCSGGYVCCLKQMVCAKLCPSEQVPVVTIGTLPLSSVTTPGTPTNSLSGTETTAVAVEPNATWVGTRCGGLFRLQGQSWTVFDAYNSQLPDSGIHSVFIDKLGKKWITSRRGYLYSYDNTTFSVLGTVPIVFAEGRSRQTIVSDGKGGLWFAAYSGGIAHLVQNQIDMVSVAPWINRGQPLERITGLGVDGLAGLWATTKTGSAAFLDASEWKDADPQLAPLETRVVSSSSRSGPWFATSTSLWWKGEAAPIEIRGPSAEDTQGISLLREGPGEQIVAAYASRGGMLQGTRQSLSYRSLGGIKPTDLATDNADGWWVAAGKAGLTHVTAQGESDKFTIGDSTIATEWRDQPVPEQLAAASVEADLNTLLSNPFVYSRKKIHLRGKVVSQPPSIRFQDSEGAIQLITPTARKELLEFWTAIMKPMQNRLLPYWAIGTETMDFYGYVEIGGCNGEIEETSLAFFITEYYPTSSSPEQRAEIMALMLQFEMSR